jgi:hypothetical protein
MRVARRSAGRRRGVKPLTQRLDPRTHRPRPLGRQPGQEIAEEAVRDAVIELVSATRDRLQAGLLGPREHLDSQPRLADPGIATHQQAGGTASLDLLQLVEREGELLLASDELRRLLQV